MQQNEDLPDFGAMSAYDLIEWLDRDMPHVCIRLGETIEAAHRYAGRRELIDELVTIKNAEQGADQ